mgnify:CR=1 FL=1
MKEFYIYSSLDNKKLCCIDFSENLKNPKIVLQICHGMAEHIRRYKDFALFLEKQGIRVFGMDNRGHGKTCEAEEEKGHIADKEGNIKLIEDVHDLNKYIKEQFSDKKIVIFGHSMGSVIVRNFLNKYSDSVDGAIICGTTEQYGMKHRFAMLLARILSRKNGNKRSNFVNRIGFSGYNSGIKNKNTDFDWLTRDEIENKKYEDNELCGYSVTPKFFSGIFSTMGFINRNYKKLDESAKILAVYGTDDKAIDTYHINKIFNNLRKKKRRINVLENRNGRHESLNEINKYEIYDEILKWLNVNF